MGAMILRYSVETKHRPAFTAKKICKTNKDATDKVAKLKQINKKEGYLKYWDFRLYDDSNCLISELPPTNK